MAYMSRRGSLLYLPRVGGSKSKPVQIGSVPES